MKTLLARMDSLRRIGGNNGARRMYLLAGVLVVTAAVLVVPTAVPAFGRQAEQPKAAQAAPDQSVECVLGLEHIKHHAKGKLTVESDALQFATDKGTAKIPIATIQDVFTGADSKQVFGGLKGAAVKAAVPYEGGRVLSLFSRATEVLTLEYRDSDNGFHGAVFILPKGQASVLKRDLVAKGAKASIPPEAPGK